MGLNKKLKEVLPCGKKAYWVNDAAAQRYIGDQKFALGGNHGAYHKIPRDEEWVSRPNTERVRKLYRQFHTTPTAVMIHEVKEDVTMQYKRAPYRVRDDHQDRGAHRAATRLEHQYLDGNINKRQAIARAVRPAVTSRARNMRRR